VAKRPASGKEPVPVFGDLGRDGVASVSARTPPQRALDGVCREEDGVRHFCCGTAERIEKAPLLKPTQFRKSTCVLGFCELVQCKHY
jgi:hypothetical protein